MSVRGLGVPVVKHPAVNGCWESRYLSDLALCMSDLPSLQGICLWLSGSVLGVTLSWAQGSCRSSRRALYVAAGYGGALSRTR